MGLSFIRNIGGGMRAVALVITVIMFSLAVLTFFAIRDIFGILMFVLITSMLVMILTARAKTRH